MRLEKTLLEKAFEKSLGGGGTLEDRVANVQFLKDSKIWEEIQATSEEILEEAVVLGTRLKPIVFALLRTALHKGIEIGLEYQKLLNSQVEEKKGVAA